MPTACLTDRAVLRISGEDARRFLDGLVTCDMDRVGEDRARYGALLTPQGKIVADFLVAQADGEMGGAFFLDVPAAAAADLLKRLAMYRLRAKVVVEDISSTTAVLVRWQASRFTEGLGVAFADPRDPALGDRLLADRGRAEALADAPEADWQAWRIARGIPEGGRDFAFADAFPHEADMDQLGGVDFDKGCYVGQEVVSRMQHRGTVRTRVVLLHFPEGSAPAPGTAIVAAGKPAGLVGSVAGLRGLGLVRLDRVEDALAEGAPVVADGIAVRIEKPPFADFQVPGFGATAAP